MTVNNFEKKFPKLSDIRKTLFPFGYFKISFKGCYFFLSLFSLLLGTFNFI